MDKKYVNNNKYSFYIRRKVYRLRLEDLQRYFNYYVFYFDESYDREDYDEMLIRTYEEQALGFLRNIGAMLSLDAFLTIGNETVYVRKLPSGITPIQECL